MSFTCVHRYQQWVQNCRRKDLMDKSPEYLSKNITLCIDHFEAASYNPGSNRLKLTAVPTLFNVPNPPKMKEMKRRALIKCGPSAKITKTATENKENRPCQVATEDVSMPQEESTQAKLDQSQNRPLLESEVSSDVAMGGRAEGRCVTSGSVAAVLSRQEKKRMHNKFYCRLYRARQKVKKLAK